MVVLHIVYHKFKPHMTPADIERHYREDLERMPFVLGWNHYSNLSLASRADVNQGFSHGVVVYLKDMADLEKYLPHPEHVKVKEIQAPMMEKVMVTDLEEPMLSGWPNGSPAAT